MHGRLIFILYLLMHGRKIMIMVWVGEYEEQDKQDNVLEMKTKCLIHAKS